MPLLLKRKHVSGSTNPTDAEHSVNANVARAIETVASATKPKRIPKKTIEIDPDEELVDYEPESDNLVDTASEKSSDEETEEATPSEQSGADQPVVEESREVPAQASAATLALPSPAIQPEATTVAPTVVDRLESRMNQMAETIDKVIHAHHSHHNNIIRLDFFTKSVLSSIC